MRSAAHPAALLPMLALAAAASLAAGCAKSPHTFGLLSASRSSNEVVSFGTKFQNISGSWTLLAAAAGQEAPVMLVRFKDASDSSLDPAYATYTYIHPDPTSINAPTDPSAQPAVFLPDNVAAYEYIVGNHWPLRATRKINGGAVGTKVVVVVSVESDHAGRPYERHRLILLPPGPGQTSEVKVWIRGNNTPKTLTLVNDSHTTGPVPQPIYVETTTAAASTTELLVGEFPVTGAMLTWLNDVVLKKAEFEASLNQVPYK